MSWAGPRNRWCTGMLKIRVIDTYLKKLKENYTLIQYVGIAADETDRLKDKCYPLVEWGMTERTALPTVMQKDSIGAACIAFSAVFPVGAVRCRGLMNYENSIGIFLIYGNVLKNGTRTLGDHFAKTIPSVSLLYVLILRKSGRQQAEIFAAGRFTLLCVMNWLGSDWR